jgi:hypothetical protein
VETRTLDTTRQLLWTLVAGARASTASRVQWVADAFTILQVAGPEVAWEQLVAEAVELRSGLRVHDALAYLATALDAPVPKDVLHELAAAPSTRRERFAHQLAGRGNVLFGNLPATIAGHIVATRDDGLLRSTITLPRTLRREWGLDHVGQLPAAAARRSVAVVAAARAHRQAH